MRPIWSGYINFGLVNIPVNLQSAEKHEQMHFHLLDARDNARIRYQKINEETGKEVPWDKIQRGYEYTKGKYVILKDEDFKKISIAAKTIAIENFVDKDEIDYEYFERPYYLVPDKNGAKSYVLLRDALKKENKIGIAKVVLHDREHLAAIIPSNDALILEILRFTKELASIKDLPIPKGSTKDFKITTKEFDMALQLINSMNDKWQPEKYHDEYREALMAWIAKKAKGHMPKEQVVKFKTTGETANLVNLMKKSIDAMRKKPHASNVVSIKRKKVAHKK